MLSFTVNDWLLWIGLFFIVIVAVLWFTDVNIELSARRRKEDDEAKAKLTALFGLVSFTFKMPQFRLNSRGVGFELNKPDGTDDKVELELKNAITQYQIWNEAISVAREFRQWFIKLLSKIELSNWKWRSAVGTGEAMSAAISCGMLWSAKGLLFGNLSRYVKVMNVPEVEIEPRFHQKIFETEWSCSLKLKAGALFVASSYLLLHATAFRKTRHLWRTLISKA